MPRVRIASVGVGWVARHRHLAVMDRSDQFEVVGVIDRKPGHAVEVAATRGYAAMRGRRRSRRRDGSTK